MYLHIEIEISLDFFMRTNGNWDGEKMKPLEDWRFHIKDYKLLYQTNTMNNLNFISCVKKFLLRSKGEIKEFFHSGMNSHEFLYTLQKLCTC